MKTENNKLEIALYFNTNLNLLSKVKIMNFNFKSVFTVRILLIVSSLTFVAVGAIFLYFFYFQPHPQIPPYRPELQSDTMRTDVFNGHFEVLGEPVLDQVFEVDFTIKPKVNAPRTTIRLFLPPAVELIRGYMDQVRDLRAGEIVQEHFSLRVTQPGEWEVRTYVSPEGISGMAWSYYLFIQSYPDHAGTSPQTLEKEPKPSQGWLDVLIDLTATRETSRNTWLVTLRAKPTADLSNCELALILPEGSKLSEGTQVWTGDLKRDRTQMIQASVTAPFHADAPVQGRCTCGGFIYRRYVYLAELN